MPVWNKTKLCTLCCLQGVSSPARLILKHFSGMTGLPFFTFRSSSFLGKIAWVVLTFDLDRFKIVQASQCKQATEQAEPGLIFCKNSTFALSLYTKLQLCVWCESVTESEKEAPIRRQLAHVKRSPPNQSTNKR